MYLADTSVWIDAFNGNIAEDTQHLLLSKQLGLTSVIYTEILQGARGEKEFNQLKQVLLNYTFYDLTDHQESYANAALIYSKCRQQGITIRSSVDCLIAQCAIDNELTLLHNDNDFTQMARVITELEQEKTAR